MPLATTAAVRLVQIIGGACALLFGRRLFWLFVATVGFVIGAHVGAQLTWGDPRLGVLLVAVAAGLGGALLALVLQEFMILAVGFVGGSAFAGFILTQTGVYPGRTLWVVLLLVAGVIGAWLLTGFFDWTLIVLSALFGAATISQASRLPPPAAHGLFAVLLVVGIVAQAGALRRRRAPRLRL